MGGWRSKSERFVTEIYSRDKTELERDCGDQPECGIDVSKGHAKRQFKRAWIGAGVHAERIT